MKKSKILLKEYIIINVPIVTTKLIFPILGHNIRNIPEKIIRIAVATVAPHPLIPISLSIMESLYFIIPTIINQIPNKIGIIIVNISGLIRITIPKIKDIIPVSVESKKHHLR